MTASNQRPGTTLRADAPELTVRTCARCGNHFVWPKDSRPPGGECPRCQPQTLPGFNQAA